ncbi:hypothetical protein ACKVWC_005114 [Pyricularia oryzae]
MAATSSPSERLKVARLANGAPDLIWNRPLAPGVKSCDNCLRKSAAQLEDSDFEADFEISCSHESALSLEDIMTVSVNGPCIKRGCAINGSIAAALEDILLLFRFITKHAKSLVPIPICVRQIKMALHQALCNTVEVRREFVRQLLMQTPAVYQKDSARRLDHFRHRGPFPYDGDIAEKRAWHLSSMPRLLPTDGPYEKFHLAIDGLSFQQELFLRKAAKAATKSVRDQMPPMRLLSQALRLRDGAHVEPPSGIKPKHNNESAAEAQENGRKPGKLAQASGETRYKPKEEPGQIIANRVKFEPRDLFTIVFPGDRKRKRTHTATDKPSPYKRPKGSALRFGGALRLATQDRKEKAPLPEPRGRLSGGCKLGKMTWQSDRAIAVPRSLP